MFCEKKLVFQVKNFGKIVVLDENVNKKEKNLFDGGIMLGVGISFF